METSPKQTQLPLKTFWDHKYIAIPLVIVGFLLFMGFVYLLGGVSHAFDPEGTYQAARQQYCEAEKNLSISKLKDFANGSSELTNEDLIRLSEKKKMDCSFQ